jgi:hypothetical protein
MMTANAPSGQIAGVRPNADDRNRVSRQAKRRERDNGEQEERGGKTAADEGKKTSPQSNAADFPALLG